VDNYYQYQAGHLESLYRFGALTRPSSTNESSDLKSSETSEPSSANSSATSVSSAPSSTTSTSSVALAASSSSTSAPKPSVKAGAVKPALAPEVKSASSNEKTENKIEEIYVFPTPPTQEQIRQRQLELEENRKDWVDNYYQYQAGHLESLYRFGALTRPSSTNESSDLKSSETSEPSSANSSATSVSSAPSSTTSTSSVALAASSSSTSAPKPSVKMETNKPALVSTPNSTVTNNSENKRGSIVSSSAFSPTSTPSTSRPTSSSVSSKTAALNSPQNAPAKAGTDKPTPVAKTGGGLAALKASLAASSAASAAKVNKPAPTMPAGSGPGVAELQASVIKQTNARGLADMTLELPGIKVSAYGGKLGSQAGKLEDSYMVQFSLEGLESKAPQAPAGAQSAPASTLFGMALDTSGSMSASLNIDGTGKRRIEAVEEAASNFLGKLAEQKSSSMVSVFGFDRATRRLLKGQQITKDNLGDSVKSISGNLYKLGTDTNIFSAVDTLAKTSLDYSKSTGMILTDGGDPNLLSALNGSMSEGSTSAISKSVKSGNPIHIISFGDSGINHGCLEQAADMLGGTYSNVGFDELKNLELIWNALAADAELRVAPEIKLTIARTDGKAITDIYPSSLKPNNLKDGVLGNSIIVTIPGLSAKVAKEIFVILDSPAEVTVTAEVGTEKEKPSKTLDSDKIKKAIQLGKESSKLLATFQLVQERNLLSDSELSKDKILALKDDPEVGGLPMVGDLDPEKPLQFNRHVVLSYLKQVYSPLAQGTKDLFKGKKAISKGESLGGGRDMLGMFGGSPSSAKPKPKN